MLKTGPHVGLYCELGSRDSSSSSDDQYKDRSGLLSVDSIVFEDIFSEGSRVVVSGMYFLFQLLSRESVLDS